MYCIINQNVESIVYERKKKLWCVYSLTAIMSKALTMLWIVDWMMMNSNRYDLFIVVKLLYYQQMDSFVNNLYLYRKKAIRCPKTSIYPICHLYILTRSICALLTLYSVKEERINTNKIWSTASHGIKSSLQTQVEN